MKNFDECYLGIELGSTRIKCCLVDNVGKVIENGTYSWENSYSEGFWTYDLGEALVGVSKCYLDLKNKVFNKYHKKITKLGGIGISAMMHGLIALDKNNTIITPFRTWRNNNTESCAEELSHLLNFNIPARWSISHVYYAIKNKERFVKNLSRVTTLSGYITEILTDKKGLGKDDASGMFPIDESGQYNREYIKKTNELFALYNTSIKVEEILPPVCECGAIIGCLTTKGASVLDPEGDLLSGVPFVAPEGDAATGIVSTNSINVGDGNVSVGTSIFGSFILNKPLSKAYPEVDVVVTPDGKQVAMIHCNNCTSGVNECVSFVKQVLNKFDVKKDDDVIFEKLFTSALDYQGTLNHQIVYNYLSNENITKVDNGAMLIAHSSSEEISLDSIVLGELFASFASFNLGMKILKTEGISFNNISVHGGLFKTKDVAQKVFASVLEENIIINKEASEGGPWGMALLTLYMRYKEKYSLGEFLNKVVFKKRNLIIQKPDNHITELYKQYQKVFVSCLEVERMIGGKLK